MIVQCLGNLHIRRLLLPWTDVQKLINPIWGQHRDAGHWPTDSYIQCLWGKLNERGKMLTYSMLVCLRPAACIDLSLSIPPSMPCSLSGIGSSNCAESNSRVLNPRIKRPGLNLKKQRFLWQPKANTFTGAYVFMDWSLFYQTLRWTCPGF